MEDSVLIAGTVANVPVRLVFDETAGSLSGENQKRIKESSEQQQAEPCVHLVGNISPDELEETFSQFRNSHAHVEIVIYDSEQISFPDNKSNWALVETFTFWCYNCYNIV